MNKYKVYKLVYGESIQEVLDCERGGVIVSIDLQDEDVSIISDKIGFTNDGR